MKEEKFKIGNRVRLFDCGNITGHAGTILGFIICFGKTFYSIIINDEKEPKNYLVSNLRRLPKINDRINCNEKGMGTLIDMNYNSNFNSYYYRVKLDKIDEYGNIEIGLYESHLDKNNKVKIVK